MQEVGRMPDVGFSGQSVPAAAPPRVADPFMQELIKNIASPQLINAATTPIAGQHGAQVPSAFTRPVQPFQPQPFNNNDVVGHKQGKLQGIGNAITGVTNALGTVVTKEKQLKQDQYKDAATKAIMTQNAIDEAQQAHDAALANGDAASASKAQEQIQKNQQVLSGIFSDPKIRKALVKGFDISYTDPESNKTEEHAAVQAAMKEAKSLQEKRQIQKDAQAKQNEAAGKSAAEAFSKSQPQGMAPNVQAQQRLATAQAQQKINQDTLKDYMTFKASIYRSDRTVDAAQMRQVGAAMLQQQRLAQQQSMLDQRFVQAQSLLKERFIDSVKLVGIRAAEARQTAMDIYKDKEADPLNVYTKLRTAGGKYEQNAMKDSETLTGLQQLRLSMYQDKA